MNAAERHNPPRKTRKRKEGELYFDEDELDEIMEIWGFHDLRSITHDHRGLTLHLAKGPSVTITDSRIELEAGKYADDEVIKTMVEHATKFWSRSVGISGNEDFKVRLWAHLATAGITVVNYTPPEGPIMDRAQRIIAEIKAQQAAPQPATTPHLSAPAAPQPRPI